VIHPVQWQPDGTPRSTLFDDVYRSIGRRGDRGLLQAREVFLQGCGLWSPTATPLLWQGQSHWRMLETGFGLGLNFLVTWAAWRADPARAAKLQFMSIEAWPVSAEDIRQSVAAWPELHGLAHELAQAWQGMQAGMNCLRFDGGAVELDVYVGEVREMLPRIPAPVDSIYLDGFSPSVNPDMWHLDTLQAVAALARNGTQLATWCVRKPVRDDLMRCGFEVHRALGVPPKSHRLQAIFRDRTEKLILL
jgi:tRNA 5-methylaminomethyl-2-thiouridine biosynthesis bifunctional protein